MKLLGNNSTRSTKNSNYNKGTTKQSLESYQTKSLKLWKALPRPSLRQTCNVLPNKPSSTTEAIGRKQVLSTRFLCQNSKTLYGDLVQGRYRDADALRTAGCTATEIYQELIQLLEQESEVDARAVVELAAKKTRQLAVYSFASGKQINQGAKTIVTKAIRIPDTVQAINDDEESDKDLVFSQEMVAKIQQARYEESMLTAATIQRTYGFGRDGGRGGRSRCRGKFSGKRGASFFGQTKSTNNRPLCINRQNQAQHQPQQQ